MSAGGVEGSTPIEEANKAARRRIRLALDRLASLAVVGVNPVDLRYALEYEAACSQVIMDTLIAAGIVTVEDLQTAIVRNLEQRATVLEARIHARLDGQKEMPI